MLGREAVDYYALGIRTILPSTPQVNDQRREAEQGDLFSNGSLVAAGGDGTGNAACMKCGHELQRAGHTEPLTRLAASFEVGPVTDALRQSHQVLMLVSLSGLGRPAALPYLVDQPLHLYDGRPAREPENGFGGSGAELSFSLSSRRCLEGFHHQIGHHRLPPRAQEGQGAIKVEDRKTQPARSGVRAEDFQHVTLTMLEQRHVGRRESGP